jgi:anti-sigma factor RsiW
MRRCEEARTALVELVFGEIDDAIEMELNRHLLECAGCRGEEQRLLAVRDGVHGPQVRPGADLRERIRAALPRRVPVALAVLGRPVPAFVAVAAAVLGALAVAVLPLLREASPPPAREESRVVGVPLHSGGPGFTVAGSYETAVASSSAAASEPGSRARAERPDSDSL